VIGSGACHPAIIAALATGWIVTVIGGYALRWTWTGYPGHTLWDWLGMLLPLVSAHLAADRHSACAGQSSFPPI
jgi:hypothetical protein